MRGTLTPILLATQLGFFFVLAARSPERGERAPVLLYLLGVATYAVAASVVGATGAYVADDLLPWLPGLWLPLVMVAVCALPVAGSRGIRKGLRRIVDETPWHWFAWFQALRISALGTLYKTSIGEFPLYFELLVGVPDLVFGLSALWIAARAKRDAITQRGFMIWNLVGFLIIVPSAPILIQLGLPGPLRVFTGEPDGRAILAFPMVIAPMIVVPLFVLANQLVAWRLWETARASRAPSS